GDETAQQHGQHPVPIGTRLAARFRRTRTNTTHRGVARKERICCGGYIRHARTHPCSDQDKQLTGHVHWQANVFLISTSSFSGSRSTNSLQSTGVSYPYLAPSKRWIEELYGPYWENSNMKPVCSPVLRIAGNRRWSCP